MAEPKPSESQPRRRDSEIPEQPLPLDINYPYVGRNEDPIFPDEYVLETSTGLVPQTTLELVRSPVAARAPRHDENKVKALLGPILRLFARVQVLFSKFLKEG
ncbi:hypothetical protein N7523_010663 [Penicillium sp. IBT 18751x]|nr:hypothetical protein N7523_010663 [Penicillium sp. IBT 18751x]